MTQPAPLSRPATNDIRWPGGTVLTVRPIEIAGGEYVARLPLRDVRDHA